MRKVASFEFSSEEMIRLISYAGYSDDIKGNQCTVRSAEEVETNKLYNFYLQDWPLFELKVQKFVPNRDLSNYREY